MLAQLEPLAALALLFGVGALAHWLAWRLRVPAILLLLSAGFGIGPVAGWLDPDLLFGVAFRPLASIAVGIILFEGGLSLRFEELRGSGRAVRNLVSIGALTTWGLSTLAGIYVARVDFQIAVLVGAVLVLTGPTVVIPLVRHVRPRAPLGAILRWEGILIDPIGAVLALLVFEALQGQGGLGDILLGVVTTLACGGGLGLAAGFGLARAIERFLVPDMLHVPTTLGVVTVTFVTANLLQPEAGLLAVTVMGIVMANRKALDVAHVAEWHEQIVTILLGMLFLCIAARIPLDQLTGLGWRAVLYTAALIVAVRPLAVLVSTLRTGLSWRQRAFLMAMAPRGIVVAAVSTEFSLHFEQHGPDGAATIVALVFPVIVLSVLVYGLAARPLGRLLGVAQADPQGALIVGADLVGRELGLALREQDIDVLLVDTNARSCAAARTSGLRVWHGSVLSSRFAEDAELAGIGNVLALTPSDDVNRLALRQFVSTFGRAGLFRIGSAGRPQPERETLTGRILFRAGLTIEDLRSQLQAGARIRATKLTEQFGPEQFRAHHGERAMPLFVLTGDELQVVTADTPANLKVGCTVLSLVPPAPSPEESKPAPTNG